MSRGYFCVGLDNPKSSVNVGSALRATGIYGGAMLATTGIRYRKSGTDTMKHVRHLPLLQVDDLYKVIPYGCIPVAVDKVQGAQPLPSYIHPERAFYIFGAEDNTLGKRVLGWCRDAVYVPMAGCMNLAACVNVVLYDRIAKGGTP